MPDKFVCLAKIRILDAHRGDELDPDFCTINQVSGLNDGDQVMAEIYSDGDAVVVISEDTEHANAGDSIIIKSGEFEVVE